MSQKTWDKIYAKDILAAEMELSSTCLYQDAEKYAEDPEIEFRQNWQGKCPNL